MSHLRKIIEMLEAVEEASPDSEVKLIVGADEKDYIASYLQAILVCPGVVLLAPMKLDDNKPLELTGKSNNEEMN